MSLGKIDEGSNLSRGEIQPAEIQVCPVVEVFEVI